MPAKDYGEPITATATHATLASAAVAGVAGSTQYITQVSVSSDKAGSILLVKQGTTVIWQEQVGAGSKDVTFDPPLKAASGALISAEVDGTAACKANINGFRLSNP